MSFWNMFVKKENIIKDIIKTIHKTGMGIVD